MSETRPLQGDRLLRTRRHMVQLTWLGAAASILLTLFIVSGVRESIERARGRSDTSTDTTDVQLPVGMNGSMQRERVREDVRNTYREIVVDFAQARDRHDLKRVVERLHALEDMYGSSSVRSYVGMSLHRELKTRLRDCLADGCDPTEFVDELELESDEESGEESEDGSDESDDD